MTWGSEREGNGGTLPPSVSTFVGTSRTHTVGWCDCSPSSLSPPRSFFLHSALFQLLIFRMTSGPLFPPSLHPFNRRLWQLRPPPLSPALFRAKKKGRMACCCIPGLPPQMECFVASARLIYSCAALYSFFLGKWGIYFGDVGPSSIIFRGRPGRQDRGGEREGGETRSTVSLCGAEERRERERKKKGGEFPLLPPSLFPSSFH